MIKMGNHTSHNNNYKYNIQLKTKFVKYGELIQQTTEISNRPLLSTFLLK